MLFNFVFLVNIPGIYFSAEGQVQLLFGNSQLSSGGGSKRKRVIWRERCKNEGTLIHSTVGHK